MLLRKNLTGATRNSALRHSSKLKIKNIYNNCNLRKESRLIGDLRGKDKLIWNYGETSFNTAINDGFEIYKKYVVNKKSELGCGSLYTIADDEPPKKKYAKKSTALTARK